MIKKENILSRNYVILKILWVYSIIEFLFDASRIDKGITITTISVLIFIVPSIIQKYKQLAYINMYVIMLSLFFHIFILNFYRPDLLNFLFILVALVVIILMLNYRILIAATCVAIFEFLFFAFRNKDIFPSYFDESYSSRVVYLVMIILMSGLSLIFSGRYAEHLLKVISKKEEEAALLATSVNKMSTSAFILEHPSKNVIFANESFLNLFQFNIHDIIGKHACALVENYSNKDTLNKIKTSIESETSSTIELPIRRNDGSIIWVEFYVEPIKNSENQVERILCLISDITEKKTYTKKLEDVNKDVKIAGNVQKELLPKNYHTKHFEINTFFKARDYVSGDLYDYEWDEEKKILHGIVIDIMGHGFSTAIQGSALRVLFNQVINMDMEINKKIRFINKEASRYFTETTYGTLIYFQMNFNTMKISVCSGGIPRFHMIRNKTFMTQKISGPLIGIDESYHFDVEEFDFEYGDSFYFSSDGILDALSKELPSNSKHNEVVRLIKGRMLTNNRDDISSLCIQTTNDCNQLNLTILPGYDTLNIRREIRTFLDSNFSKKSSLNMEIAVNEAINNFLQHTTDSKLNIHIRKTNKRLYIRMKNSSYGFDWVQHLEKIENSEEEYADTFLEKTSGRGIYIMKKTFDTLQYNRSGNDVLLVKNWGTR